MNWNEKNTQSKVEVIEVGTDIGQGIRIEKFVTVEDSAALVELFLKVKSGLRAI